MIPCDVSGRYWFPVLSEVTTGPSLPPYWGHIAALQRHNSRFETNIATKGIARPQSQFPLSCVCERFVYSHDLPAYSAAGKYVDRSWEYTNRSQTHECRNWVWGRAIPFLGIHKWDFRSSTAHQEWGQLYLIPPARIRYLVNKKHFYEHNYF